MSASRSRSSSRSVHSSKPRNSAVELPWFDDGIDYGPANAAARDLATWALDIAERDVDDWPAARKRVRNARRWVLARLAGKDRHMPVEDIIFTASLLARIFDDDLDLDLADAISIFDALDLPTDVIPVPPPRRPTSPASVSRASQRAVLVPTQLRLCDECGYVHEPGMHVGYRNAA